MLTHRLAGYVLLAQYHRARRHGGRLGRLEQGRACAVGIAEYGGAGDPAYSMTSGAPRLHLPAIH